MGPGGVGAALVLGRSRIRPKT